MKLSEKLKRLMLENGISSAALANYTNIDQVTINRILNNSTQAPKTDTIYTLAKFFNIDVRELIIDKNIVELELAHVPNPSLQKVLRMLMECNGNMSVNSLHKYTNISRAGISDILNEKTKNPNVDTLRKLADYFRVSILQLCGLESIELHKLSQIQTSNISVPLINFDDIVNWQNGQIEKPNGYIQSTIKSLKQTAFAFKIIDNSYAPDFFANQVLVVDNCLPATNNFAIYHINHQTAIYEFIAEKNQSIILRKAGDYNVSIYQANDIQLIGTIIQHLIA